MNQLSHKYLYNIHIYFYVSHNSLGHHWDKKRSGNMECQLICDCCIAATQIIPLFRKEVLVHIRAF